MAELVERLRTGAENDPWRAAAGLLIGIGFVLVAIRASFSVDGDGIGSFTVFLIIGAASAILLAAGYFGALGVDLGVRASRLSWPSIYLVAGVLLLPIALTALIDSIDSTPDGALVTFLIFGTSAAVAIFTWARIRVPYQLLVGGVFALLAALALFEKVVGLIDHPTIYRLLTLAFALSLVAASQRIGGVPGSERRSGSGHEASELLSVAGLTVVAVTAIGLVGSLISLAIPFGGFFIDVPSQSVIWDLLALLAGIALIIYASFSGIRGPGYVGALLLLIFAYSVGLDLDDDTPEGTVFGWPILVLLIGAGLFAYTLRGDREPSASAPPPAEDSSSPASPPRP